MTCRTQGVQETELVLVFLAPPLLLHNSSLLPLSDSICKFYSPPPMRVDLVWSTCPRPEVWVWAERHGHWRCCRGSVQLNLQPKDSGRERGRESVGEMNCVQSSSGTLDWLKLLVQHWVLQLCISVTLESWAQRGRTSTTNVCRVSISPLVRLFLVLKIWFLFKLILTS